MEKTRWVNTGYYAPTSPALKVCQVVGEGETQKSLERHICLPHYKPAIEQVVDVFVRRLCLTDVRVITDKVIVRGHFEIKLLYVACLPAQPVHALEIKRVHFTADVPICGVRCGMYADANAMVEYADYDCHHRSLARWYKEHGHEHHCHPPCECECTRECDIFVVLRVIARVISSQEVIVVPYPNLPAKPKG